MHSLIIKAILSLTFPFEEFIPKRNWKYIVALQEYNGDSIKMQCKDK